MERDAKAKKKALKALLGRSGLRKPNAPWCFHHASKGRGDVLQACLDKKTAPETVAYVDPEGGTLLHVAALQARVEHVRWLLTAGANPNLRGPDGVTPLGAVDALEAEARTEAHDEVVRLLDAAGGV